MDRRINAHRLDDLHHNKDEYSATSEIIHGHVSNAGILPQNQELFEELCISTTGTRIEI